MAFDNHTYFSSEIATFDGTNHRHLTAYGGTDFIAFRDEVLNFPLDLEKVDYVISLADGVDVPKQLSFEVCLSDPTFGAIDGIECAIIYIDDDDCKYDSSYAFQEIPVDHVCVLLIVCILTHGIIGIIPASG